MMAKDSGRKELVNISIGTAGHIDHGKTALVKLMTGCNTDTLREEQKRGLTINLGFAPCTLGGNKQIGIVDVPGHERFIKNMVAGASGIDVVLLVVAADDSVMPQTVEHLNIIELLGINKGLVALTKIDMVEEELVELAKEDVAEFLKGTILDGAPICPVSSITGEGFNEFYKTLNSVIDTVEPISTEGLFRLPVERAFSVKGIGTIITGIPATGSIRVGETVEVLPIGKKGRIRTMQVYSDKAEIARAGECVALNVTDVDKNELERGMAVVQPGYFEPSKLVAARFQLLANAPMPLRNRSTVRFHTGTSETMATVVLLEKQVLRPGESSLAQFRLDEPIVTAGGDHYIIRYNSPVVTAGGGLILGTGKWKFKTGKQFVIDDLSEKEAVLDDPEGKVEHIIKSRHRKPVSKKEILKESALSEEEVNSIIVELAGKGRIRKLSKTDNFIHVLNFEDEEEKLCTVLSKFYKDNPLALGMDRIELRDAMRSDKELFTDVLENLVESGDLAVSGRVVSLATHEVKLSDEQEKAVDSIEKELADNPFSPPSPDELAEKMNKKPSEIIKLLDLLVQRGAVLNLDENIYFGRKAVEDVTAKFVDYLRENEAGGAKTLRDLLGTSRKYAYALLDHIDGSGITVRVKNLRYLKSEYKS